MAFDPSAFITRTPSEALSVRIMNERTDFIGSDVAPPVYVPKSKFSWYKYDLSNLRQEDVKKDSKSEADKIEYNVSKLEGDTILRKLGGEVDPRDEKDADPAVSDMEPTTAAAIMEKLLMEYEQAVYAAISTAANYPSGSVTTLAAGNTFADDGGADPVKTFKDLRGAVRLSCGKIPQAAAMSFEVLEALKVHPALIERIKYTGTTLSDEQVMSLLGVQKLFIGKALTNTAKEGQADALTTIWGDAVSLFYWNPSQDRQTMAFLRTFVRQQLYSHRYEDHRRGSGDGRIKVLEHGWEYDLKAIAQDASSKFLGGGLIANAI